MTKTLSEGERLLPCPFCGDTPAVIEDSGHSTAYEVACIDENCRVNPATLAVDKATAIKHWNRRTPAPVPGDMVERHWQKRVPEVLAEGDGHWRTCTGCHESEDGYDVGHYPTSSIFQCKVGSGCHECGGIGMVWDNTDYSKIGEELALSAAMPGVVDGEVLGATAVHADAEFDALTTPRLTRTQYIGRAILSRLPASPAPAGMWRPIAEADRSIATVQTYAGVTMRNSYPVWVRDADGRIYEAVWTDSRGGYWWDLDGEDRAHPVEFMPHPLDQQFAPTPPSTTAQE